MLNIFKFSDVLFIILFPSVMPGTQAWLKIHVTLSGQSNKELQCSTVQNTPEENEVQMCGTLDDYLGDIQKVVDIRSNNWEVFIVA